MDDASFPKAQHGVDVADGAMDRCTSTPVAVGRLDQHRLSQYDDACDTDDMPSAISAMVKNYLDK